MQSKKRIAFFGDDFSRKGKGTALVIQKIAEGVLERHSDEFEITLLRPAGPCGGRVCDAANHVIVPRRFSTALSFFWFFLTHRDRYDAVVFNRQVYPGFWFLKARKRVLFQYDASISEVFSVPRTKANRFFEFILKFIGQYFLDVVIAASEDAQKWISRYFSIPAEKVRILFLAADGDYKRYSEDERAQKREGLKKKYKIQSPYILGVSRFDPHKNVDRLVEAFLALKKKETDLSLVLVGGPHTPGYSERVLEMIHTSEYADSVTILNYVEHGDMPAIYNCARFLVYPSLVEGWGMPPMEAMQCGTPVITSNVSALPEAAGGAALLVDPLDSAEISAAMAKLLEDTDLRNDLIAKGLARAHEFSWGKTTEAFLEMLR